jgi:hypothetical protein
MADLSPHLRDGRYLTRTLMADATRKPKQAEEGHAASSIFHAVECVTKGIEVLLPAGHYFYDKDGHKRHHVRVRWWDEGADTLKKAAILPPETREQLPDEPLPMHARVSAPAKPVFFGHYWLTGDKPSLESKRAVCLDYSAGKGGPLVAYRFDSEPELVPEHFVWV